MTSDHIVHIKRIKDERLSRLFDETWERIPNRSHRKKQLRSKLQCVTDDWSDTDLNPKHDAVAAISPEWGLTVYLRLDMLARYPGDAVRYIIAHELAHAVLGHVDTKYDPLTDEMNLRFEDEANSLARAWGFTIYTEDTWQDAPD
jgi:hypothetical protein